MHRWMCKGKIHRVRVTEANPDYVGHVTIDESLMKAAKILPYELVQITNLRNAARWATYALPGGPGTGILCLNGRPANLFKPGDITIVLNMGLYDENELSELTAHVVFVDDHNRITSVVKHRVGRNQHVSKHTSI